MKKIVIGLHGLGNKPPKEVLENWWRKSLEEGLKKLGVDYAQVPFELVYWRDIMYSCPLNPTLEDPDDLLFLEDPYMEREEEVEGKRSSVKIKLMKYVATHLDKIFLDEKLKVRFKKLLDRIIYRYFADLGYYFSQDSISLYNPWCSVKDDIQNRLLEVLRKYKGYQILLVAHSMGSIVAFDLLSKFPRSIKVETLITIGAPLGLPVIKSHIFTEQKNGDPKLDYPRTPDCIRLEWYNLFDMGDYIALDHKLHEAFSPNCWGISSTDIEVYNDFQFENEDNPHKSYGYLRTPELAVIVSDFLSRSVFDRLVKRSKMRKQAIGRRLNKVWCKLLRK